MAGHTSEVSTRKSYFYLGGIVILAVILILSIVLLVNGDKGQHQPCSLLRTTPDLDSMLKEIKNVASPDHSALANLIGYIHFPGRGFIPVSLSELDIVDNWAIFTSECARLSWKFTPGNHGVILFNLDLEVPSEEVSPHRNGTKHMCTLATRNFDYSSTDRFSCKSRVSTVCRAYDDKSAATELVLASIELELQGDEFTINKGEFSKGPALGSCNEIGY